MSTPSYYLIDMDGHDLYDLFVRRFGKGTVRQHQQMVALEYLWRAGQKGAIEADMRKALGVLQRALDEPEHEERLPEKVVQMWCEANGYMLMRTTDASTAPASFDESLLSPLPEPEEIEADQRDDESFSAPAMRGAHFIHDANLRREYTERTTIPTGDEAIVPSIDRVALQRQYNHELSAQAEKLAISQKSPFSGPDAAVPSQQSELEGPPLSATLLEAAAWFFEREGGGVLRDYPATLERIKQDLHGKGWPLGLHYHSHKVKLHEELPGIFLWVPKDGLP